jgi:hypothetical protein
MIKRVFDLDLLLKASAGLGYPEQDFHSWITMPQNLMFAVDDNVGIATFDYPGLYTVHWYFAVRGRKSN